MIESLGAGLVGILALSASAVAASGGQKVLDSSKKAPNVVFVLTDDQDLHMDSLNYMPRVQKNLIQEGTFFKKHFCTIAVCCPSRASLWTGKAAHNTNVTDLWLPYGGMKHGTDRALSVAN